MVSWYWSVRRAPREIPIESSLLQPVASRIVISYDNRRALVGRVNVEVMRSLSAGAFVVYTQDWHPESTPHFEKDGGIWPVHCVMDTWGAALHPRLEMVGPCVRKGSNGEDGY